MLPGLVFKATVGGAFLYPSLTLPPLFSFDSCQLCLIFPLSLISLTRLYLHVFFGGFSPHFVVRFSPDSNELRGERLELE